MRQIKKTILLIWALASLTILFGCSEETPPGKQIDNNQNQSTDQSTEDNDKDTSIKIKVEVDVDSDGEIDSQDLDVDSDGDIDTDDVKLLEDSDITVIVDTTESEDSDKKDTGVQTKDTAEKDPTDTNLEEGCECNPGVAEKCDINGSLGLRMCEADCQWTPCTSLEPVDTDTDSEEVFLPPEEHCQPGYLELNIKDVFTAEATPHLNNKGGGDGPLPFATLPNTLRVMTNNEGSIVYGAQPHPSNCGYFRTCIPKGTEMIILQPNDPSTECGEGSLRSAPIDISDVSDNDYLTMYHDGSDAELTTDFFDAYYINKAHEFQFTFERPEELVALDPLQPMPLCTEQEEYVALHIRWPWGDAEATGFAGTGCEGDNEEINTGGEIGEREYPPSLMAVLGTCETAVASLERNDGFCPWYKVLIPKSDFHSGNTISFKYANTSQLLVNDMELPDDPGDEFWLVYEGPDDHTAQGTPCNNYSYRPSMYHFYTANLGPAYPGCGGQEPPAKCEDIKPVGFSVVHFRYLWAGQKTFTYFPKDEFMPKTIFLHVNGTEYPCVQEGASPWFRCPIPNDEFFPGSEWRAVDKAHEPEWNTVEQEPTFPSEPGEYWMRWHYGKPDIPEESEYDVTDYYPDGVEWAKAGSWGDDFCFTEDGLDWSNRPPIESDGFYPWNETNWAYDYGQSIAKWYDNWIAIQDLLDYFVYERYLMWKEKYVIYGDDACGEGTARVNSEDSVSPTVSEGQGYGMAITAAIGDKKLFDQLWRFVNHFLSQSADKYCGGLMGWNWKGPEDCQPYGEPHTGTGQDSAFDGDVDIAIGLIYAAWQWPEYTEEAVDWILKMECEINKRYDGEWYYPTPGDTWNKNCGNYPEEPCDYTEGIEGDVNMSYYPPGYFRVFGEFLMGNLNPAQYTAAERRNHRDFWYRTAETVWEMTERCYDQEGVHPALLEDFGFYETPCSRATDNYNWSRGLWRLAIDAAWYGNDERFNSTSGTSSYHYDGKSQVQAKMDLIQNFYSMEFPVENEAEENANRFSTICQQLTPAGDVTDCDPAYSHNSYFVGTAMSSFVTFYDNDGLTTPEIRREALEEAVSVSIQDSKYYQQSIGVYALLFLTGNFPRPYSRLVPEVVLE
ncbi:MAG: hypothetical protein JXX14_20520 [Deltaproteobacteria bacterium]|nr:hypothetical protein [Deltaproteobacteria bacterium]